MKTASLVLIGAGNRGRGIFGQYALDHSNRARFVAVVEPDPARRNHFAEAHAIPEADRYENSRAFFAANPRRIADGLVLATREDVREETVHAAVAQGYNILCEKPVALTAPAAIRLLDHAGHGSGFFMVCHQMRHTPLYGTLKHLIESGKFGRLVNVVHSENVSYEHMAHSFVRGFFNNDSLTPLILAKACHDMDLLVHLTGCRPTKVASFGQLTHFRLENAPAGAPIRCTDGCPASDTCPYDVRKVYFRPNTDPAYLRQMGVLENHSQLYEALKTNRFGRCVFHCDNNVIDHQVCSMVFEEGITASFVLTGHNAIDRRRTMVQLTDGELELDTFRGTITTSQFSTGAYETLEPTDRGGTHSGGDWTIMDRFIEALDTGNTDQLLTTAEESLDSHLLAFAAEESRRSGQVVALAEFENRMRQSPATADRVPL